MIEFYVSKPKSELPDRYENDLQRKIFELLENLGIEFSRVDNEPAITMEACKNIDKAMGVETIKTVFLTNRQQTKFYLLAMPADKPFVTKIFGAALQIPRVSFASSELLESILGTPHGVATPLSILMDTENQVKIVIDKEISERTKIVCTDGTLHGFICLKMSDLMEKYFPAAHHQAEIIDL